MRRVNPECQPWPRNRLGVNLISVIHYGLAISEVFYHEFEAISILFYVLKHFYVRWLYYIYSMIVSW